jgi:hypothetical protein
MVQKLSRHVMVRAGHQCLILAVELHRFGNAGRVFLCRLDRESCCVLRILGAIMSGENAPSCIQKLGHTPASDTQTTAYLPEQSRPCHRSPLLSEPALTKISPPQPTFLL